MKIDGEVKQPAASRYIVNMTPGQAAKYLLFVWLIQRHFKGKLRQG